MNQSSVKGNKILGLAIQGVNGKAGLPIPQSPGRRRRSYVVPRQRTTTGAY